MGSNTLKFSVTEVTDSGVQTVIHAHAETVRLGAGVAARGSIEPQRMERALAALRDYETVAKALGVEACIGVATAALRMARNGDDLLGEIARTTGWNVRVITGADEARLAFAGIVPLLPPEDDSLLLDVGGGSTEAIHATGHAMSTWESIEIGSGTLADRYFSADPPGMVAVRSAVGRAHESLTASTVLPTVSHPVLVLSGGNGQFLEAFAAWPEVDIPFTPGRFGDLIEALADTPARLLAGYLGIVQERARMLPAGAAIAMAVIERARPTGVRAVPSGIRGGLVAGWIAANPGS